MAVTRKRGTKSRRTKPGRGPSRARRAGFPPHARLFRTHVLPATERALAPSAAPEAVVRKSALDLTPAEQTTFKSAVTGLRAERHRAVLAMDGRDDDAVVADVGKGPELTGAKNILDPWTEQASEVLDPDVSGYRYAYDRMTL